MSNPVLSVQSANSQSQADQTTKQQPKKPETAKQNTAPQDTVNISKAAQQAQANSAKAAPHR